MSAGAALLACVSALIATFAPIRDKKRDREHAVHMAHIEVYESRNADAIEEYIQAANTCINLCQLTDEFKNVCTKIYLHVYFKHWGYVDAINEDIYKGEFDDARNDLLEFCRWTNWLDFGKSRFADERASEANKPLIKRLFSKLISTISKK